MIDNEIWDDEWVDNLPPPGKLLWIYLLSNSHLNIAGCYKITRKRIATNTGISYEDLDTLLEQMAAASKLIYRDNWMYVRYVLESSKTLNAHILKGIQSVLQSAPDWAVEEARSDFPYLFEDAKSWVYLIRDGNSGLYKIGFSNDPDQRCKTIANTKTICPSNAVLKVVEAWYSKVEAERVLHELFGEKQVLGEWFRLTDKDVDTVWEYFHSCKRWTVKG